ncbi:iron-containing redox enzyme family protein [Sandaracinus amylolyticus]|uniref:Long-chain acyl-CoA synthetase n=1 Tax=Sandaracinus amylolyticus TaxID=927083 RepID=A0A0F6SDZ5_9BACT|nr:iron-containing redox enzyme family protein [Sandaracinus amylolyticus]AKF04304.1 long-chain acyl-CoA synthetase [Sandaracinus amylolyticus]
MNAFEELQSSFRSVQAEFLASAALRRVAAGGIGLSHYASYLSQVFHHTRENPQIQALATVYFRGAQRELIKPFFRHATSEIGHDRLALDDLRELGAARESLPFENPLPETCALIAFPFYQIQNLDPIGYLGYLYFLEFLPTGHGAQIMTALERAGVPRSAMRFLHDHTTIDVHHNRMMEDYARALIRSERDLATVLYAMRVTGRLYARMIEAAFADADAPGSWGLSTAERIGEEPLVARAT